MIKSPIQEVTNKLQFRAIGIVKGIYKPNNVDQLNRGTLTDKDGKVINQETVFEEIDDDPSEGQDWNWKDYE